MNNDDFGVPRPVHSNQLGVHEDLDEVVKKYKQGDFRKPVADHTRSAFESITTYVEQHQGPLIFDSCCGVGESTKVLAEQFPDALVVGIDKSAARLEKNSHHRPDNQPDNMLLVQADLNDFWRLASDAGWVVDKHFILYPNPWPKKKHLQRRWHGSPVFPWLVQLGGEFELRSNWKIYLQEFQQALALYKVRSAMSEIATDEEPITPFERKYKNTKQRLWQLRSN